jgi:hypothetical protein
MRRTVVILAVLGCLGCSDPPAAAPSGIDGIKSDAAVPTDTAPRPDTRPIEEETTVVDGYPAGPYEAFAGYVFPPLSFDGYRDASPLWTKVSMREYFDGDGTKGIDGVVVIVAAEWCEVCKAEARWQPEAYNTTYKAKGAKFITTLIQDSAHKPAVRLTADTWRDYFKLPYAVAIDPTLSTLPKGVGTLKLPYVYVIDPRTMRIEKVYSDAQTPGSIPALDTVLARNAG